MKLAAFYIPSGYQSHIFGENHQEITINLGGEYLYEIENGQVKSKKPNPYFIDDIFSKDITLFSCIVGNNGAGKTSLLNAIANAYHCAYLIEYENGAYELRENIEDVHRIYYTPYLHHKTYDAVRNNFKDLSKYSLVILDNHGDSGQLKDFLDVHHSENIKRWIKFNSFYINQQQREISLPVFREVEVKLNHFKTNIDEPDNFHDTSSQLRHPIIILFEKIKSEKEQKETNALQGQNFSQQEAINVSNRIRFEYDLYETFLGKLVSVLERIGNRYLDEGIIDEDYIQKIDELNVKDALSWFLQNAGVIQGGSTYTFAEHTNGLALVTHIISLLNEQTMTDNWRIIDVSNEQALAIIKLYDAFNESFINEWFEYDHPPMFTFKPKITTSSGEQSFLNLFSTLYYHSQNIKNKVDVDYHSFSTLKNINDKIMLLIDEGDNAFHPQWKKEFVKLLREILPKIFQGFQLQVIITSHDPLTLSDFPKNNVVFLERNAGITQISQSEKKRTFGANISDLLKDSFFIQNGQIGSFTADVIDRLIQEIGRNRIDQRNLSRIEGIISCIDEPILKFKLAEMLSESLGENYFERKLIDDEISRLNERRDNL